MSGRKLDDAISDFVSTTESARTAAESARKQKELARAQETAKAEAANQTFAVVREAFNAQFQKISRALVKQHVQVAVKSFPPDDLAHSEYVYTSDNGQARGAHLISLVVETRKVSSGQQEFAAIRVLRVEESGLLALLCMVEDARSNQVRKLFAFDAEAVKNDPTSVESETAKALDEIRALRR
jgi:hypothetical protein